MVEIQVRSSWSVNHCIMRNFVAGLLICISSSCLAQYFQFSQYNFTPQRINPALVASSDFALLNFDYRNQATDGGFHLTSNSLNVSYPLQSRKGGRWSGIGISLMDDRSGNAGIFATQEAALSYAVNIDVAKYESLSMGVKFLYQSRKIDARGLYTGSQYIPDRGFDESIDPGEDLGQLNNNFMTFSAGLHWHKTDKKGIYLAYGDLSFFDLNRPEDSFLEPGADLGATIVASGGFRIYHKGNMSIYPEILYTRSASNNVVNAGAIFRCDLKSVTTEESPHVDFITKYVFGRSGLVGMQFHNEKFSIGFSYDFPLLERNVANTGAFEIGLTLRRLVIRSKNKRNDRDAAKKNQTTGGQTQPGKRLGATVGVKKPAQKSSTDSTRSANNIPKGDMSVRLKEKQDSVIAKATAGKVDHEPLILEKATLRFNFEFNSISVGEDATAYLDELAKALTDNPELNVKLVGHTDNIGSEKFNIRLSLNRAQALKNYLMSKGISASRVTVDGKGMSEPVATNHTDEGRSVNRRVEMTILYDR